MLRVRKEQMRAFQGAAEPAFLDRLIDYLREREGQAVIGLSDTTLRERVQLGLTKARGHGMTWESSLAAFVTLMFHAGPYFYRHRRVRAVLEDAQYGADERMRRLWFLPMDAVWQETRPADPEAAWKTLESGEDHPE